MLSISYVNCFYNFAGNSTAFTGSDTLPTRVIIHGHSPEDKLNEGENPGKLIYLPETIDEVLKLAGEQYPQYYHEWSSRLSTAKF